MNFKFCFALTGAKLLLLYFLRIFLYLHFITISKFEQQFYRFKINCLIILLSQIARLYLIYLHRSLAFQCSSFSNVKRFMIIYGLTIICSIEIVVKVTLKNS